MKFVIEVNEWELSVIMGALENRKKQFENVEHNQTAIDMLNSAIDCVTHYSVKE